MEDITDSNDYLEALGKEYATQDNRCTAYPTYVTVQELTCIGVMADGYSVAGDGVNKTEWKHSELEGSYDSEKEIFDALEEYFGYNNRSKDECANVEELNVGYVWQDVEFFLTIKGAEEYMKANAHNHGKLRTYVKHFERRNFEMRGLLNAIGFNEAHHD